MHGIRDEGDWTDVIENRILRLLGGDIQTIKIPPVRYNRFAMLPFLLYWDRQRNVRRFMDQYTEDLARYPNLKTVDYFGHSNGTYIVASALQQYPVLEVRNVLFAGSVVPSHYSWARPLAERRVQQVRNVVADADWVVGLFPQVFELFSQHVLREEHSGFGLFDVGAAGFRGHCDIYGDRRRHTAECVRHDKDPRSVCLFLVEFLVGCMVDYCARDCRLRLAGSIPEPLDIRRICCLAVGGSLYRIAALLRATSTEVESRLGSEARALQSPPASKSRLVSSEVCQLAESFCYTQKGDRIQ
jgi:hypothetical protein